MPLSECQLQYTSLAQVCFCTSALEPREAIQQNEHSFIYPRNYYPLLRTSHSSLDSGKYKPTKRLHKGTKLCFLLFVTPAFTFLSWVPVDKDQIGIPFKEKVKIMQLYIMISYSKICCIAHTKTFAIYIFLFCFVFNLEKEWTWNVKTWSYA